MNVATGPIPNGTPITGRLINLSKEKPSVYVQGITTKEGIRVVCVSNESPACGKRRVTGGCMSCSRCRRYY